MSSSATPIPPAAAIGDAPYRSSLLSGAFSLFFLSFVMSGNGNAVPQLFFQRFYPEQKTVLLSASLLVSTTAAIAAVVLSRRHRLSQQALIAAMLATVMAALALYLTRNGAVFIATIVLVQFAVNYLTNQLDHASIARAGALRRVNDAAGVLARLWGMLAAPAFFTTLYDSKTVSLVSVGAVGLLASAGAAKLLMMPAAREAADPAS